MHNNHVIPNSPVGSRPLISVVLPIFNAGSYLSGAIESILAQTYANFELIAVDDGSDDGSAQIIRHYAQRDERIRPFYLAHRGVGGALNAGVAAAKGELIARMDADDIALPERFATQVTWMNSARVDICGSCVKTFGAEQRIMWFPETHEAICNEMVFRCALLHPTILMRTEIARRHPYDESSIFEDYEFWTRLAGLYRMGNVPQVLLKYRVHPEQTHIVRAAELRADLQKFSSRYYLSLYPEASQDDQDVIKNLVLNEPAKNLAVLGRAGTLLLQLADCKDRQVQKKMAQRWWGICSRSNRLGPGVLSVYNNFNRQFGSSHSNMQTAWLFMACVLRLQADTGVERFFRKIHKKLTL